VEELLPHLQARGEDSARDARNLLTERGAAEAKAMREILETQRKHITDVVAQHSKTDPQLRLRRSPQLCSKMGTMGIIDKKIIIVIDRN